MTTDLTRSTDLTGSTALVTGGTSARRRDLATLVAALDLTPG